MRLQQEEVDRRWLFQRGEHRCEFDSPPPALPRGRSSLPGDGALFPRLDSGFHLSVFMGAGRLDSIVPSGQVEELGAIFERGGADVTISWRQGEHELGEDDIRAAKTWLSKEEVRRKVAA